MINNRKTSAWIEKNSDIWYLYRINYKFTITRINCI